MYQFPLNFHQETVFFFLVQGGISDTEVTEREIINQ